MHEIAELLSRPAAQRVGWALLHSLWQGTVVALVLAASLQLLRRRSPQARWAVSCLALAAMAALPAVTACMVSVDLPEAAPIVGKSIAPHASEAVVVGTAPPPLPVLPPVSFPPAEDPAPVPMNSSSELPAGGADQPSARPWLQRAEDILHPLLPWAVVAWLVGVTGMSLWHVGGWLQVRRLRHSGAPPADSAIRDTFGRLLQRLHVRRPVRLVESVRVAVPIVVGWLRPVILLPASALSGLSPTQLEAVLAHELAHIRRWDCLVKLLQAVVETLLFYHPAVWWVSHRIREESENCCDDIAAEVCGDRKGYADALAEMASMGNGVRGVAAAATGGKLLPRIRRIVGLAEGSSHGKASWLAAVLIVALATTGMIVVGCLAAGQASTGNGKGEAAATAPAPSGASTQPAEESKEAREARIAKLIERLGSTKFADREEAQKELVEIGVAAIPALRKAAGGKDPERTRRAEAVLERLTTMAGTVLDEAGEPVKGALVRLLNPRLASAVPRQRDVRYGASRLLLPGQTHTDPAGRFKYSGLPVGKTDILVTKGRRLRSASLRNVPVARVNITVRMGKPRPYRLGGRVLDPNGQPVPGAGVTLVKAAARIPAPEPKLITVRSDSAGRFRFAEVLRPLRDEDPLYRELFVSKPGFGFWGKSLDCTGGETEITVRLAAHSEVKGTVVDAEGKPVRGAHVWLWSLVDFHGFVSLTAYEQGAPKTRTDATGAFVLRGLPGEGVATIRVACDGYSVERASGVQLSDSWVSQALAVQHKAGEPLKVTLRRAAILRGTAVYEGSGRPAAGLTVATQGTKDRAWSQTKTGADGTFELPNVTPSPCNVLVLFDQTDKTALPAWAAAAIPIAELKPGEVRKGLKIILTKGGVIQGKVTDAKGHPLRGINIGFYSAARPRTGAAINSVDTREDGTWSCRFPPGPVHIYVRGRNPGLKPWAPGSRDVLLKAGQTLKDIDFRLGVELPEDSPYRAPPAATTAPATQPAQSGFGDRELERVWGQIGNEDHKIAYAAVTELSRGGDRAVAFMRARLKLPPAGPGSIDKLVADLNSDKYAVRKGASEQLTLLGRLAEPALYEALAGTPSAEMQARIEALLKARSGTVISQAAWRILRAMRVLEKIGTPAAMQFLRELRALEIVPRVGYYQGEGHALLAGLAPDRTRCVLGEPAFITFFVRNLSDKPYKFFVGGASRGSVRDNNVRITAVDVAGKPVRDPHAYRDFEGVGKDVELKPGEVYANRVFLGHWCAFDRPGKYKVTCRRTLNAGGRKRAVIATEGSFAFEVLPASGERMRKVVAALGSKLRGGNKQDRYEATLALSAIHDVQVIPHLAASLRTRGWRYKGIAVQALSRFSTDSAAEALCVALKDPDQHLGAAAGKALKRMNKTDYAVDRLLVEFKKATGRERAAVARALGWTRSRRTMGTLVAALADRDAAVRPAAAEAIGALGDWGQIQTLKRCLKDKDMGLRVAAVKALHALDQPIQAEWLTPVIRAAANVNDPSFHEAIRLLGLYGKDQAARGLVSCLHFDNPAVNHSYNMYLMLAIQADKGVPKYHGKYHHDPGTKGTPEQIVENGRILIALKAWLAEQQKAKRPELPAEVKQALAEAMKIRIKHPEGGLAMWRELAALVKPGWTMQHMKMILVWPGGGGMMSSKGQVTVSYGVQGGAFMVIAEGKYVAGASYEKRDGDDKIVLTTVPRIEKRRPAPSPAPSGASTTRPGSSQAQPADKPATQPGARGSAEDQLQRLWVALGSADVKEADEAAKAMVVLGDRAVAFLAARFYPPPADAGRVKQLIAKLDDAKHAVRKKAYDELMQLGRAAFPALKEALKQPKLSVEARARINGVVKNWTSPAPGAAQARRFEGALLALAGIGTARARGMLARLGGEGLFPIAWGKVADGLQAGLVFDSGRRPYRIGQKVRFSLKIRNVGLAPIPLTYSVSVPARNVACDLKVFDSKGRYAYYWMSQLSGRRYERIALAAGEMVTAYSSEFMIWPVGMHKTPSPGTLIARPGRYRVTLTDRTAGPYTLQNIRWSSGLTTGEIPLEVVPAEPGDPIVRELAKHPAPPSKASPAELQTVLSLLGQHMQQDLPAIPMGGVDRFPRWRKAWEKSCASLKQGEVGFLGHVAATYPDATSRAIAVEALGAAGRPQVAGVLVKCLGDTSPRVRGKAARALGELRSKASVPNLLRVLRSDKQASVRASVAYGLGHIGSSAATRDLVAALKSDRDRNVRSAALCALGWITDPAALPGLREVLKGASDESIRRGITNVIRNIEDPDFWGLGLKKGMTKQEYRTRHRPLTQPATQPAGRHVRGLSPVLQKERDKLLAQADAKIRKGLVKLAKRFPQLEKDETGWKRVSKLSPPGHIWISLRNPRPRNKADKPEAAAENDRYNVGVAICPKAEQGKHALRMPPLYSNLALVGSVHAKAGKPELDAALRELVSHALAPLKQLEVKAAGKPATQPAPTGASSKGASTRPPTITRREEALSNWPRANPKAPPADKAFEKSSAAELIQYVIASKEVLPGKEQLPRELYGDRNIARLACAWFIWKTRQGAEGPKLRAELAKQIDQKLTRVSGHPERSLHDASAWASMLGPLGAREIIIRRLAEPNAMGDCCYGPALVEALADCGDPRDVPVLIAAAEKEMEANGGSVDRALVRLTGRKESSLKKDSGYTDADAWRTWWKDNAPATRPADKPATQPAKPGADERKPASQPATSGASAQPAAFSLMRVWAQKDFPHQFEAQGVFARAGHIYVGAKTRSGRQVAKIEIATGQVVWSQPTQGTYQPSYPVSNGRVVIFGTYSEPRLILGLDDKTGKQLWQVPTGGANMSAAAFADDLAFIGSYDKHLYAIDWAKGTLRWKAKVGGKIWSRPAVVGKDVFVACYDGKLYRIDARTGAVRSRTAVGRRPHCDTVIAGGLAFLTVEDRDTKDLVVLDIAAGKTVVRFRPKGQFSKYVVVDGNDVYFFDASRLFSFDLKTRKLSWTFHTRGEVLPLPLVYKQVILLAMNRMGIEGQHASNTVVLARHTGKVLRRSKTGGVGAHEHNSAYFQHHDLLVRSSYWGTEAFRVGSGRPASTQPAGRKRASVTGRVLDKPGGKGTAGSTVALWSHWTRQRREVTTDEAGDYSLTGVCPGPHTLGVVGRPAGVLTEGLIIYVAADPKRHPQGKTRLMWRNADAGGGSWLVDVGLGPGPAGAAPGGERMEVPVINPLAGRTRAPDLHLQLPQGVSGTVRDEKTRKPVGGAMVGFVSIDRNAVTVTTNAEGQYRLYLPPRGVQVCSGGTLARYYPGRKANKTVTVVAGQYLRGIDLEVRGAPEIAGEVVFADGRKPPAGTNVWALLSWADTRGPMVGGKFYNAKVAQQLTTDARGKFTVYLRSRWGYSALPHQEVTVTALAWSRDGSHGGMGRTGTFDPRKPPAKEIKIVLAKTGRATFRVGGPGGEAVTEAKVSMFHGPPLAAGHLGRGRYRVGGLIPGFGYRWYVDAPGYRHRTPGDPPPTVVEPGQHVEVPAVKLDWWDRRAVPQLIELAPRGPEGQGDQSSIWNLGNLGPAAAEAVPVLTKLLKGSRDKEARRLAAQALGRIGRASRPAVGALVEAMQKDAPQVARYAAEALGRIGDPMAVPPLQAALKAGRVDSRAASLAIWRISLAANHVSDAPRPNRTTTTRPAPTGASTQPGGKAVLWGKAVRGVQLGLAFGLKNRPYRVGELVGFKVWVRNTGAKEVRLVDFVPGDPYADRAHLRGWCPTVRDPAGKTLLVAGARRPIMHKRVRSLSAGQGTLVGTVFLKIDARPQDRSAHPHLQLRPGKYRVSQTYRFRRGEGAWSGELSTGQLTLIVVRSQPAPSGASTQPAVARPRTLREILARRGKPDLEKLAARVASDSARALKIEDWYDLLKLREVGDEKAIPALAKIVAADAGRGTIFGHSALQALYCIGGKRAKDVLGKYLLKDFRYSANTAYRYTFHWDMSEPQRSGFIRDYVLKAIPGKLAVQLEAAPAADGQSVTFTMRLRNVSADVLHLREPQVYLGRHVYLRTDQGPYLKSGETPVYHIPVPRSLTLKPKEARDLTFAAKLVEATGRDGRKQTVLRSRDYQWFLSQPGPLTAVAMFEAPPLSDAARLALKEKPPWIGRAVSKPVSFRIGLPAPAAPSPDGAGTQPAGKAAPLTRKPAAHGQDMGAYIRELEKLRENWHKAAQLVHEGKRSAATAELARVAEESLPRPWGWRHGRLLRAFGTRLDFPTEGAVPRELGKALWYVKAEAADLAVEAFEDAQEAGIKLDFARTLQFSTALIEAGKYPRARGVLAKMLETKPAHNWQRILKTRTDALAGLRPGQGRTLKLYRTLYSRSSGLGWYRQRLFPILGIWHTKVPPSQLTEKGRLLAELFELAEDRKGQRLAMVWVARHAGEDREAAAKALCRAAQIAAGAREIDEAMSIWARVEKDCAGTSLWGQAVHMQGVCLRKLGKHTEAIAQLKKLTEPAGTPAVPGAPLKERGPYPGVAQLLIGQCLFEMKQYEAALEAFNVAEKKFNTRPRLRQGLCLERLGRPKEAAAMYLDVAIAQGGEAPAVLTRLVDLYEAAEQLKALEAMFRELDRRYQKARLRVFSDVKIDLPPSRTLRRTIELHEWLAQGKLDRLAALIGPKGTLAGPEGVSPRWRHWEAFEAARLLGRRPDKAVPILETRLESAGGADRKWLYYALGMCGTPEAVSLLVRYARLEQNVWWQRSAAYGLSLAGEPGMMALKGLAEDGKTYARILSRIQAGDLPAQKDPPFPPIPKAPSVPTALRDAPPNRNAVPGLATPPATQPAPTGAGSKAPSTQPNGAEARRLEALWERLAEKDYGKAYQAVRLLAAHGDKAVNFLRGRVRPASADPEHISKLIADLGAPEFATRERASEALSLIAISVEEALHKELRATRDPEVRARLKELIANAYSAAPTMAPAWRRLRAIRVLERIGTPGARALLRQLAAGAADARATQQAARALRRLGPAGKTDSATWWLARAEEEAELWGAQDQPAHSFARIAEVLADAGHIEAALALTRRADDATARREATYRIAAAYARAGNLKAANEVATLVPFPSGHAEMKCHIGVALARTGRVEPSVPTSSSADWIAATAGHPPLNWPRRSRGKWRVPEIQLKSVRAQIHAAIAVAHARAGRAEDYRKHIEKAEALGRSIPGDIQIGPPSAPAVGKTSSDTKNVFHKSRALEAALLARGAAGDYTGARKLLKSLPAGNGRDGIARSLVRVLAEAGAWKDAGAVLELIAYRDEAYLWMLAAHARAGNLKRAKALYGQIRESEGTHRLVARMHLAAAGARAGGPAQYEPILREIAALPWFPPAKYRDLARIQAETRAPADMLEWSRGLPKARLRYYALLGTAEELLARSARPARLGGSPGSPPDPGGASTTRPSTRRTQLWARRPRATVEAFLAAVATGQDREAMRMADPASAVPQQIKDFREIPNLKGLKIARTHADDAAALVATEPFELEQKGKTETVLLQLALIKSRGQWVVSDIDLETPQGAKKELESFLRAHRKAVQISPRRPATRPAGELEAALEALSRPGHTGKEYMVIGRAGAKAIALIDQAIRERHAKRWTMIWAMIYCKDHAVTTPWLIKLAKGEDQVAARAAREVLVASPRKEAGELYVKWLSEGVGKREVLNVLRACVKTRPAGARDVVKRVADSPWRLLEYREALELWRSLAGKPFPKALLEAERTVTKHGIEFTDDFDARRVTKATEVLARSQDVEAASAIALSLASYSQKSNHKPVNRAGIEVLRRLPGGAGFRLVERLMRTVNGDHVGRVRRLA